MLLHRAGDQRGAECEALSALSRALAGEIQSRQLRTLRGHGEGHALGLQQSGRLIRKDQLQRLGSRLGTEHGLIAGLAVRSGLLDLPPAEDLPRQRQHGAAVEIGVRELKGAAVLQIHDAAAEVQRDAVGIAAGDEPAVFVHAHDAVGEDQIARRPVYLDVGLDGALLRGEAAEDAVGLDGGGDAAQAQEHHRRDRREQDGGAAETELFFVRAAPCAQTGEPRRRLVCLPLMRAHEARQLHKQHAQQDQHQQTAEDIGRDPPRLDGVDQRELRLRTLDPDEVVGAEDVGADADIAVLSAEVEAVVHGPAVGRQVAQGMRLLPVVREAQAQLLRHTHGD